MNLGTGNTYIKTYTAAGYLRAQEHERIVEDLCDTYMDARKVVGADDRGSEQTHLRGESVLEHLRRIIEELIAWEKVNL